MIRLEVDVFGDAAEFSRDSGIVMAKIRYRRALEDLEAVYADAKQWLAKRVAEEEEGDVHK